MSARTITRRFRVHFWLAIFDRAWKLHMNRLELFAIGRAGKATDWLNEDTPPGDGGGA